MTLVKFKNGQKDNALNPGFNDIFESFFNDSYLSDRMISRVPAANISETEENYIIDLAAPGLKKENFKIQLDRNLLTISFEQSTETKENMNYNKREFSYNSFVRSFALPDSVDNANIEAEYNNGILRIFIAKKEEAKMAVRQINIK
jgi:HSP20 family protein